MLMPNFVLNYGPIIGPLVGAYAGKIGTLDVWTGRKNASNRACLLLASMRVVRGLKKLSDDL